MAKSPEYPRLDETNLAELEVKKNGWLGETPHFEDDSELLTLYQVKILQGIGGADLPPEIETALQSDSAFSVLDRRLSTHSQSRRVKFVSKEKTQDIEIERSIKRLWNYQEGQGDRGYNLHLTKKIIKGMRKGVGEMRERRTRSLIEEFKEEFRSLGDMDVWMRTAQINGGAAIRAARLVDFSIYGRGKKTVIEPVVVGLDDTRGLLPRDSLYVQPHLNIRL